MISLVVGGYLLHICGICMGGASYTSPTNLASLLCLVHGDSLSKTFKVQIDRQQSVADLKELTTFKVPSSLRYVFL